MVVVHQPMMIMHQPMMIMRQPMMIMYQPNKFTKPCVHPHVGVTDTHSSTGT
jgi:hypothetical protein